MCHFVSLKGKPGFWTLSSVFNFFSFSDGPQLKTIRGKNEFEGQKLKGDEKSFKAVREKLLKQLGQSLTKRFIDTPEEILKATKIVKLANWPEPVEDSISGIKIFIDSSTLRKLLSSLRLRKIQFLWWLHNYLL